MRRSTALTTTLAMILLAGTASAGSFNFDFDADWDTGTYNSTNSGPPGVDDQVQLNPNIVTQFDFIWVALSGRNSVALINTNYDDATDGLVNDGVATLAESRAGKGAVRGEYYSAPQGQPGNPSRTTVDINGDVWVGNRDASSGGGSAVKITATPGEGARTSSGVWDSPTSNGTFNRLSWSNAGGADTNGGTSTAQDDAVQLYIRTPSTGNRTIAIDSNNDVWIGGLNNRLHAQFDGDTGAQIGGTNAAGVGGYGGVIDGNGILWSSDWSNNRIGRYDTNAADPASAFLGAVTTGGPSYGLGIDNNGNIWNSHYANNAPGAPAGSYGAVSKLAPDGTLLGTYTLGLSVSSPYSRGVAVTPDNNVWVASSRADTVPRLDNDGNVLAQIAVGDFPTGVSVDSNGKVWVTNQANNSAGNSVMRIDPATNQVDLKVELGNNAAPYNYSDMTGSLVGGITNPTGSWVSGAIDGGLLGTKWDTLSWNADVPADTSLSLFVRAADTVAGLSGLAWKELANGADVGLMGQFAQIRALFTRQGGAIGAPTPALYDLTLTSVPTNPIPLPASVWLLGSGMLALWRLRARRTA
jgi:streptogramin lyase